LVPKKKAKKVHDIGQKMANLAPIIPEKQNMEKIAMDGTRELNKGKSIVG
jgi:hypothetical protein